MARKGDSSKLLTTRITPELEAELDRLGKELHMTRGHMATLLLAAAVQRESELLKPFRTARGATPEGGGR